ncbi:MAG: 1-phosphofructokinase family hexose kinase [Halanaerobiales bacterium]|nr:1-phosphofructokinase family hexose kinase [Halanaerobiales bacterium]
MSEIVTLTLNPAIDKSSEVANVIAENKLYCSEPLYEPGGGGINVSRAIHKLGGSSLLIYLSGGLTGQRLDQLLKDEDLNIDAIDINQPVRENLIILEEATNLQYRFGMPGPKLNNQEIKDIINRISNLKQEVNYLVLSGSLPKGVSEDIYAKLVSEAKKRNIKVIVDTRGEPLKEVIKEGVFLIKPNIGEFNSLVGKETKEEAEIINHAKKLIKDKCCNNIVISLGAGGALFVNKDSVEFFRPPTVPIKSKVGAGDSMVAGIVLSLSKGRSIEKSVLYGLAAGSSAVMTPGTELCKKEDTEILYKKMIADS